MNFFRTLDRIPWSTYACLLGACLPFAVAHVLRVKYLERRMAASFAKQAEGQLRNAQELHDRLLQAIHGLTLSFHVVTEQLDETHPVRPALKVALQRADSLVVDSRRAMQQLEAQSMTCKLNVT